MQTVLENIGLPQFSEAFKENLVNIPIILVYCIHNWTTGLHILKPDKAFAI